MNLRGYLPKAFGLPRPTRPHSQKADACVFGGISQSLLPGGDTLAKMEVHGGNLGLTLNTAGLHTLQKVAPFSLSRLFLSQPREGGMFWGPLPLLQKEGSTSLQPAGKLHASPS